MYKIYFTLNRSVTVSDDKGKQLQGDWTNNLLPRTITIDDKSFLSSDIKGVEPIDSGSNAKRDVFKEKDALVASEYNTYRGAKLKLSPAERAKSLHIAKIIWFAVTGLDEMPLDVEEEVIDRQAWYFKENPKCIHPDPMCFKDVMNKHASPGVQSKEGMTPIVDPMRLAGMNFVEQVIRTDKKMAAASGV